MSSWVLGPIRPLALRIPVLMIAMLVISLATMGWLGYDRINRFAEEAETTRLQASSSELLSTFQSSITRLRAEMGKLAAHPTIGAAVGPLATTADRAATERLIAAYRQTSPQFISVALWDAEGRLIGAQGDPNTAQARRPSRLERGDSSATDVSPMTIRADTIVFSVTAPVLGADSTTIGYVVATRRSVNNSDSRKMYRSLVGPNARILFGNRNDARSIDLARGRPTEEGPVEKGAGEY
jgi:hypothetical protein